MTGQIDSNTETPQGTSAYLTVHELAGMLRVKERKVYDLAAAGEVPCLRITGKLLFPADDIQRWMTGAVSGGNIEAASRPPIVLGSHDPLLDWALRQSRAGLASFFDGSGDGLRRFEIGEGIAAGLHLPNPSSSGPDAWNTHAVEQARVGNTAVLIGWSIRQRGLILAPGLGREVRSLADLAGRRVVPRQAGSGTQSLFDAMIKNEGLNPSAFELTDVAPDEDDAARLIARGEADAAFGLEALARPAGLDFVPLVAERFDLLVDRKAWFEPQFQKFWEFCTGPNLAKHAAGLAGYDIAPLGQVRWNG
ncbi:helix-turn-helix transcriptional regulator [Meridianimarinicoccus aquatilis]|uniref:Helix-turn-helix domain-containing protein n=1 Tax=Meridianimarinicoccus aquatilis TaxID=2552766 RepID=A0A4V3BBN3_9RHOB|nr:helix-turn-helix transcriptional regulator [Fluviibacterium aquatile]QIE43048.1 helix-turn-helix transcriptional regulator [Rhodobacteraceae bacterium SC52]TDL87769.1 helix-turn-helix domain-containing protein [Fluviibacterium aquatile]